MMSRASASGPPPFWLWKLTRASGIAASVGDSVALELGAGDLAVLLEDDVHPAGADVDALEHALDARDPCDTIAATRSVAASVCLSVLPGGRVMLTRE